MGKTWGCLLVMTSLGLALTSPTPGTAQESGGVRVGGNVTINATANSLSNQASQGSTAVINVGTVGQGTAVKGDIEINARVNNVSNRADSDSCSEVNVGTVGQSACGR
ncbi:hypothetical protein [Rhodospirillum rubrum]|uniref:Uncharacterized protein n=1 Tax=Rhodospirillum rubrum (strain ATCC 11170 / ATH 1.1.1 / DSM 467 / LMG 4362 / NCIMB 8255 / S1) TaxID=269796 RepID=Q2RW19_RHORT|nr:hypothetical protein [Rhodospirillum rubrum]ABC21676.1 hypothetical protein Rru_A0875 [Rhodospirillum rubrum ATCC 11170]AEO47374.1 hypothetical protein F11_04520 [Rhodospirillum rubrum F11]MBK5953228.1 hypothetical protein [Rhodospirillum rubrum]QXG81340.1 hypothetical protein KUL73_04570 [Rhodospirillum rubrum]HAQ01462.1 hypothetical protein [Rhodospirillum rubrum]